jgi:GNAT superfamily N-acetyltransferase
VLRIEVMTVEDTLFAGALAEEEGWAHRREDFLRLIEFEPEGCFLAWQDEEPVGMVTTTSYGDYAFLGCLIVRKEERRKRIGLALMEQAIRYLKEIRVETIELDGVFPAVDLYRKLGFRDKYLCVVFKGRGDKAATGTMPYVPEMADQIIDFDRKMTGLNREKVLRRLLQVFRDSVFVMRDEGISAYAVAKPRPGGFLAIGPFVAENRELAERMLHSIMGKYQGRNLAVGVPQINREAVDLLLGNGFVHAWPCLRMYLGKRIDYHRHIYGIIAPEKG